MTIKMILAADQGNSIGWTDGTLPWKISLDMQRFKNLTMGHTVVMGRTTYQSLKLPDGLPNRRNVVLTRRPYSEVRGQFGNVEIISNLDWVKEHQLSIERSFQGTNQKPNDIWIIGGASVYTEAIERQIVSEIYFTQVNTISGGDVTLSFDMYAWKLFILRQAKVGVNWEVTSIETPAVPLGTPSIAFVHFKRID